MAVACLVPAYILTTSTRALGREGDQPPADEPVAPVQATTRPEDASLRQSHADASPTGMVGEPDDDRAHEPEAVREGPAPDAAASARTTAEPATDAQDPEPWTHEVIVVQAPELNPTRSASDFSLLLGARHFAPIQGTTGAHELRRAPGAYISQHSGHGKGHQIFLRGFDAVHGQDVEVEVGGIPVNEVSNVHAQGYVDLHFLIPEAIRELRSSLGPYDPRQGDFGVAGSMRFNLGATWSGVFARLSTGQFGLLRAVVGFAPDEESSESFVLVDFGRSSGFGPSRAWRQASMLGQWIIEVSPGRDLRFFVGAHSGRFDSAGVVRADDFEAGRIQAFDTYNPFQGGAGHRVQALVEIRSTSKTADARLSTFVVTRRLLLRHDFTGFFLDEQGDLLEQRQDTTTLGGRARYRSVVIDGRLEAELGASFRHDFGDQQSARLRRVDAHQYALDLDNGLAVSNLGVYGDLNLSLHRRLELRGGVRVEAFSFGVEERLARGGSGARRDAFGFHAAPRATLEFAATDRLTLFGSAGTGFRSPQAASVSQGEASFLTISRAGEAGARLAWSSRFSATLAAFASHVAEDLIFDHATGRNLFDGPTLRSGGALVVDYRPRPWLRGLLSATYTRAVKTELGSVAPFVPPIVARLDLEAHEHLTLLGGAPLGVFAALGANALGPRPLPHGERAAALVVVDAGGGLEWGALTWSVEASNLLGTTWRDSEFVYASDFRRGQTTALVPARHFTAGPPFSVQTTFTMRYP